jgi:transposase
MLRVAREQMGVTENKHLRLIHADGLDFIRADARSGMPFVNAYDVIILDVAAAASQVLYITRLTPKECRCASSMLPKRNRQQCRAVISKLRMLDRERTKMDGGI